MTHRIGTALRILVIASSAFATTAAAEGIYTEAQANDGKRTFDVACSECHHASLKGTGHGPELAGPNFLAKWGEHTAGDIYTQISTKMPPTAPHSLSEATAVALTAHMLRANGAPSGNTDLRANSITKIGVAVMGDKWLASMAVPANTKVESWAGAGSIAAAAEKASGFVNRAVEHYTAVTDTMLKDPAAGDWLSWRRTQDGKGYSPLAQVNRRNVTESPRQFSLRGTLPSPTPFG